MNLILATRQDSTSLEDDDNYLLDALKERKQLVSYSISPWGVNCLPHIGGADVVLLRSTWDYHEAPNEFLSWCKKISENSTLFNPYEVVLWNHNKGYLEELAVDIPQLSIIPSKKIVAGKDMWQKTASLFSDELQKLQWPDAVLKPTISLGSLDTIFISNYDSQEAIALLELHKGREFLLQPFIKEIEIKGEVSLIYLNGLFSHAVRKVPKKGDKRSQPEFGSTVTLESQPRKELLTLGSILMKYIKDKFSLPKHLLYGRVDFIDAETPFLIELELIEPCLYFQYKPLAATDLVTELLKRMLREAPAAGL